MGVIPPPVYERPKRPAWGILWLTCGVCVLLLLAASVVMVMLGYSRLDAPPAEAAAKRTLADSAVASQQAQQDASLAEAGEALGEDFDYARAMRRWQRQADSGQRALIRELLLSPRGMSDDRWIIFANRARTEDDWPESLDPGRHEGNALRQNAAEWLAGEENYQTLVTAIRHDLAWRVRNAAEEEYPRDEPYLEGVGELGVALALCGLAAAEAGDREGAWEHLELLASLGRQLQREPDPLALEAAITLQFYADRVLWALLDDGPLPPAEQTRHDAIREFRANTEPIKDTLALEAALAPGRGETAGFFPRLAHRVLYDNFWGIQEQLVDAFDEPPHEAIGPLRERGQDLPVYADESRVRLRQNLYLYRVHWQSRFCWDLLDTAAALKQWKAMHGEYPVTLDELVEAGMIEAVPIDPVWGKPVEYTRMDEGFALYMLRVEDWYWLYDRWMNESDPNDLEQTYGLDWEIVWRALK